MKSTLPMCFLFYSPLSFIVMRFYTATTCDVSLVNKSINFFNQIESNIQEEHFILQYQGRANAQDPPCILLTGSWHEKQNKTKAFS